MQSLSKSYGKQIRELLILLPIAFLIRTYGFGLYQVPSESMETTLLVGEKFFADKFTVLFWAPKHGDILSFNNPNHPYSDNPFMHWFQMYIYGPENVTKRVIGMPGDSVKGAVEDGKPVIYLRKKGESDYQKLNEPYLNKYPIVAVCPHDASERRIFEYRTLDPEIALDKQPFYRMTQQEIKCGGYNALRCGCEPVLPPGSIMHGRDKILDEFEIDLDEHHYWVMGDNRLGSGDSRSWGPLHKKYIHGKIVFRILSIDSNESWQILDLIKHPIDFWSRVRWSRCLQIL